MKQEDVFREVGFKFHEVSTVDPTMKQKDMNEEAGFKLGKVWEFEWKEQREGSIQDSDRIGEAINVKE